MKKLIYIFFISIISFNTHANEIYYIDVDYVLNNSNLGKKIISKLKSNNNTTWILFSRSITIITM